MLSLTRNPHLVAAAVGVTLALAPGCGGETAQPTSGDASQPPRSGTPDPSHDPHDIPLTEDEIEHLRRETARYAAAVRRIGELRDTIRHETTRGTPADAHRSLDKLDLVLDWLPEIAQRSDVPREHWQTVGEESQNLRDLFDRVHANIDAGRDPDYAAVADEIDRAIERLEAVPDGSPVPE